MSQQSSRHGRARGTFSPATRSTSQFWGLERQPSDSSAATARLDTAGSQPPHQHARLRSSPPRDTPAQAGGADQAVIVPRTSLEALNREYREFEAQLAHHGADTRIGGRSPPRHADPQEEASALSARQAARTFMHGPEPAAVNDAAARVDEDLPHAGRPSDSHTPLSLGQEETAIVQQVLQRRDHVEMAKRIRVFELECSREQARAQAAERTALRAEKQLADANVHTERMNEDLRGANSRVRELSKTLAAERDDTARLRADVAALKATIDQQQRTSATKRHEAAALTDEDERALRRAAEDAREEASALRKECERLRDKVARHQVYSERVTKEVESLRAQLRQARDGAAKEPPSDSQAYSAPSPATRAVKRPAAEVADDEKPDSTPQPSSHGRQYVVAGGTRRDETSPRDDRASPPHSRGSYATKQPETQTDSVVVIGNEGTSRRQREQPAEHRAQPPSADPARTRHLFVRHGPRDDEPTTAVAPDREATADLAQWPDYSAARRGQNAASTARKQPPPSRLVVEGDDYDEDVARAAVDRSALGGHQQPVEYQGRSTIAWSRRPLAESDNAAEL